MKLNKFDLQHIICRSSLEAGDKNLLIFLVLLSDENWTCWPGTDVLSQVRGIKRTNNFKGVETYLPGLVTVTKDPRNARKNVYTLNVAVIAALPQMEVASAYTRNSLAPVETATDTNAQPLQCSTIAMPGKSDSNAFVVTTPMPTKSDSNAQVCSYSTYTTKDNTEESRAAVAGAPALEVVVEHKDELAPPSLETTGTGFLEIEESKTPGLHANGLAPFSVAQHPGEQQDIHPYLSDLDEADKAFAQWVVQTEQVYPERTAKNRARDVAWLWDTGKFEHLRADYEAAMAGAA